jgi:hypothetical protein
LYHAIVSQTDVDSVNGIAYRKDGEVVQTAARTKFRELDDLPF